MSAYLMPVNEGKRIPLDKAVVFIGRHPDCDFLIPQSKKISRKHCCIAQVNGSYVIRDLGSMNGVQVNGKPVTRDAALHDGDEVLIGDCRFILKGAQPQKPLSAGEDKAGRARGGEPVASTSPPPASLQDDLPLPPGDSNERFLLEPPMPSTPDVFKLSDSADDKDDDSEMVDFEGDDPIPLDEPSKF